MAWWVIWEDRLECWRVGGLGHDGEDKEAMRHRWMMNDPKGVGA